jgi:hypothetical protein
MWPAALMLLAIPAAEPADAVDPGWEEIRFEEGIRAWQKNVEGTSLVKFRGRGVVEAQFLRVAAVIRVNAREKEWMEDCSESFTLRFTDGVLGAVSYNRTQSPFFLIDDRDTVVEAKGTVDRAKHTLRVDFHNVENDKAPPIAGVVRMPKVVGYWLLTELGPNSTDVVYEIQADPGGSLPSWVVNWASKELSLVTIRNLRTQVLKPGYEKEADIIRAGFDWRGFGFAETASSAPSLPRASAAAPR